MEDECGISCKLKWYEDGVIGSVHSEISWLRLYGHSPIIGSIPVMIKNEL